MSQSDTFMLALVAALPVWIAAKLIVWAQNDRLALSLRASIAQLALVAVPILLLCVAPLLLSSTEDVKGFAIGFAKNAGAQAADEANLRMTLWRQPIERGIESGMLGLGPGPHLEIPPAIVAGRVGEGTQPTNLDHPSQNGTANYEAHNTVLDVFTQGGLLAVTSVVWLLLRAGKVRLPGAIGGARGFGGGRGDLHDDREYRSPADSLVRPRLVPGRACFHSSGQPGPT